MSQHFDWTIYGEVETLGKHLLFQIAFLMEGAIAIDIPQGVRAPKLSKSRSAASCSKRSARRARRYVGWRHFFHRRGRRALYQPRSSWDDVKEKAPVLGICTITLHRLRRLLRPHVPHLTRILFLMFLILDARSNVLSRISRFDHFDPSSIAGIHGSPPSPAVIPRTELILGMVGIGLGTVFAAGHFQLQSFRGILVYLLYRCFQSIRSGERPAGAFVQCSMAISAAWLMKQVKKRRRIQLSDLDGTFVYSPKPWNMFGFTESDFASVAVRLLVAVIVIDYACTTSRQAGPLCWALTLPFALRLAIGYGSLVNGWTCTLALTVFTMAKEESHFFKLSSRHTVCLVAALMSLIHNGAGALSIDEMQRPANENPVEWYGSNLKFPL
jgi:hypothetical protein